MMPQMSVRVRYAPSPTGLPHIGNIRTALFNWLYARHHRGAFIVRLEDTDRSRYEQEAERAIFESLDWLGLDFDEGPDPTDTDRDIGDHGPYVQSRRLAHYEDAIQQLLQEDRAYRCYCSTERLTEVRKELQRRKLPPKYDRRCRDLSPHEREGLEQQGVLPVVRFAAPLSGETTFHDAIRGAVTFQNETLDDFVLMKSDGYPTYHLASVVDDHLMEITHVLRGEEWVSSTPRHVLLYQAFGWEPPVFAHLPMILGPDRAKLSKRHGDTSVLDFKVKGFLPDALVNFLSLLGWSLDDHTEIMSRRTLTESFDLDRVLANPAVFNHEKLTWMNGVYIRNLPPDRLAAGVRPFLEATKSVRAPIDEGQLLRVIPLIQERIKLFSEAPHMADFFFAERDMEYETSTLPGKKLADSPQRAEQAVETVLSAIEPLDDWTHEAIEAAIRPLADELDLKAGVLFGLVRVAVTGRTAAPPLFETMEVLGRSTTVARLASACQWLKRLT
jgi:glutamyl-tRNA synthetase